VKRLVTSGSKDTWSNHLTGQLGMLQPLSDRTISQFGIEGTGFELFCEQIDIKNKDQVVIGADTYLVYLVRDYNFGNTKHMEVILTKATR
jgi:hypothetical protein